MIKKNALIATLILGAAAFAAPGGTAQAQGWGRGPVASACAREINRHCSHLEHGRGAVRACLQAHRGKLSRSCRSALRRTGRGWRWR
jgi:hypothetical protein